MDETIAGRPRAMTDIASCVLLSAAAFSGALVSGLAALSSLVSALVAGK